MKAGANFPASGTAGNASQRGGFGGGGGGFGPPASAAGSGEAIDVVIDVGDADFEQAVLERSLQVPVLLDCWAPWCGPCKSLTPVLEKLAREYGGQFILAKLNTDEAPQLAAALQLRSIPTVMLFIGGQPVGQFTGAQTEGQIRAFLAKHLQEPVSPVEELRALAAEAPDAEEAMALLHEALTIEPGHPDITMDVAERLIAADSLDDATRALDSLPEAARNARHAALTGRIALAKNRPAGDKAELAARVKKNGKDFDARFGLAAILAYEGDFSAAFEQLLDVVLRDKADAREKARLQLVAWFDVCPDPAVVSSGRRYLGMYLN
ncbi:MAG: tetratricopeptide repeat protein [Rubrivivax sp.]